MIINKATNIEIRDSDVLIEELRSISCYANLNDDELNKIVESIKELALLLNMTSPDLNKEES